MAFFGNISSHSFLEGPVLVRQDQSGKFWWSGPVRKDLNLLGPLVHYPAPLSGPTKYLFFKSCVQVYNLTFCFYTLKTKLIIVHTLSFSMFLSIIIHTCQIKRLRKSVKLVTSLLQVHFCADRNARIMYIYCTYITNLLTQCIAGHSLHLYTYRLSHRKCQELITQEKSQENLSTTFGWYSSLNPEKGFID